MSNPSAFRSASSLFTRHLANTQTPGAHAAWRGQTVRLFGGRLAARAESGAAPGSVLSVAKDALRVAAHGGVLEVAKLKIGAGAKVAAGEAGIGAGERLG